MVNQKQFLLQNVNKKVIMSDMGLKEVRESHGLTQQKLADMTGIKQTTISRYEYGDLSAANMTLMTAKKICDALHCSPWELWSGPIGKSKRGGKANGLLAKAKREQQAKQNKKTED